METYKSPLENSNAILSEHERWKKENAAKPVSSTPEQMERLRKAALDEFGTTEDFNEAFYMLPDGRMLNGSYGEKGNRYADHRDINSPYVNVGVDLQEIEEGGNSNNMLDFMRGGNLRIVPEFKAIDLMSKPTEQQLRAIRNLYKNGYLNRLEITDAKSKRGNSLGYLDDIINERQIVDFIRKHYGD